jgi:hypothetical protein
MQTFSAFYKSKSKPKSATQLPKIESQESSVDISLLDVMAIDDFLSHMKSRTEHNWKDLWKETCVIAEQLKASRELLSIGSNLLSHKSSRSILNRLLDITKVLLDAERVIIMELDTAGHDLIITHALDEKLIGVRSAVASGIEGEVAFTVFCCFLCVINIDICCRRRALEEVDDECHRRQPRRSIQSYFRNKNRFSC